MKPAKRKRCPHCGGLVGCKYHQNYGENGYYYTFCYYCEQIIDSGFLTLEEAKASIAVENKE